LKTSDQLLIKKQCYNLLFFFAALLID